MSIWTIEPRDTAVLRDGRPIPTGAGHMRCLPAPWPSTTAGLVRSRFGLDARGHFTLSPADAREIAVRGPWLVELDGSTGTPTTWWASSPADCAWTRRTGDCSARHGVRLAPAPLPAGTQTDLPAGLELVQPLEVMPEGKAADGPAWWSQSLVSEWLFDPPRSLVSLVAPASSGTGAVFPALASWLDQEGQEMGLGPLPVEQRTHVKIDPGSLTADEGNLFITEGLRLAVRQAGGLRRFAFAVESERPLDPGVVVLGGERRPALLRHALDAPGARPALSLDRIPAEARRLRVLLLTPALFRTGFAPAAIRGAAVRACVVDRPLHVSGWDFAARGPKATRRCAPAGSVYWVELPPGTSARDWASETWMTCVSDDEQDRRDGFGLALVGVA